MLGTIRTVTPVLVIAALAVGGLGVAAHSLSLATDVGRADQDVCNALAAHGSTAVERLEASGFPHASTSPQEVYALHAHGEQMLALKIDWTTRTATCLPPTYAGPVTAKLTLNDAAYGALVVELRNVLEGHDFSGRLGNWWAIWWGSNVSIPSNEAYANKFELQVAAWGAGRLADEVA